MVANSSSKSHLRGTPFPACTHEAIGSVRVLILEDRPADAELMVAYLERGGYLPQWRRVDTETAFIDGLAWPPDVVLADYLLPAFTAQQALAIRMEIAPDVPFIVVTGSVGEEAAVECLKSGATDYLLKDRLGRLGDAVAHALSDRAMNVQRKRAEQSLVESEARFRRMAENARDVIFRYRLTRERGVEYISPAVYDMTEYAPEEWYQNPDLMILRAHPEDRALLEAVLRGCWDASAPLMVRWTRKDGRMVWTEQRLVLVRDPDGTPVAVEGIVRDISERKTFEDRLEALVDERTQALSSANRKLEEVSHHKSMVLANMSHELRTPLNAIIGFSELLLNHPMNGEQREFVTRIRQAGDHLLQLVNDLLDLSRIEAGRISVELDTLRVSDLIDDVTELAQTFTDARSQTLRVEIAEDVSTITTDVLRFRQILLNLLSNAVKFTSEEGLIRLTVRRHDSTACVCAERHPTVKRQCLEMRVTDSGVGIRKEDLGRLFQVFVQLENTEHRFEGSGLGLALTRALVELHGGQIWAESEGLGRGATFVVLLPVAGPLSGEATSLNPDQGDLVTENGFSLDPRRLHRSLKVTI